MKNLLKNSVSLIIVIGILLIAGVSNAASSTVGMSMNSKSSLKEGETITVNINVTKISEDTIGGIMGTLNYDSNVLEFINVKANGDWQEAIYVPGTKILAVERNNFTNTTGKIATITFKVKENINVENTTISYNVTDIGTMVNTNITSSVTLKYKKEEKVVNNEENKVEENSPKKEADNSSIENSIKNDERNDNKDKKIVIENKENLEEQDNVKPENEELKQDEKEINKVEDNKENNENNEKNENFVKKIEAKTVAITSTAGITILGVFLKLLKFRFLI